MRFYAAPGERADFVADLLRACGAVRMQTGASARDRSIDVLTSELVIVLLPGDSDVHVELGMAVALAAVNRMRLGAAVPRVVIWAADWSEFAACAFYGHDLVQRVVCPVEDLASHVLEEIAG